MKNVVLFTLGMLVSGIMINAQSWQPDLPVPQINATAVCVGSGDVQVSFTPDVDGTYRLNGHGGDLPVGGTEKTRAGFQVTLTANDSANGGAVWRNLHVEFWMRFYDAATDTYRMDYMTVGHVTPSDLNCQKNAIPAATEQSQPSASGEWYTGPLIFDGRVNADTDYAIFADSAGVRIYQITDYQNQRGHMVSFLSINDIQARMAQGSGYVVFTASGHYQTGIGRTAAGALMAFIRRGSSYTMYVITPEMVLGYQSQVLGDMSGLFYQYVREAA